MILFWQLENMRQEHELNEQTELQKHTIPTPTSMQLDSGVNCIAQTSHCKQQKTNQCCSMIIAVMSSIVKLSIKYSVFSALDVFIENARIPVLSSKAGIHRQNTIRGRIVTKIARQPR